MKKVSRAHKIKVIHIKSIEEDEKMKEYNLLDKTYKSLLEMELILRLEKKSGNDTENIS